MTQQHHHQRRPGYHLTPGLRWMNDPNGLVWHDGRYHVFFQHNPHGDTWGNMSWGHASSPDLVRWTEHPVAIPCDADEEVWSGSVVLDHRDTSGLGGGAPVLVAIYTSAYPDGRQAQSLAYSRDGGETWVKHSGNPVLDRGSKAFRDPKVFWQEPGHWVMVAVEAEAGEVLFHRSDDLLTWEHLSTFAPGLAPGSLWECPDLFALPVGGRLVWVLVVSLNPDPDGDGSATRYFVGDWDGVAFTPTSGFRRLDHGRDCYAAVTFADEPSGRRLLLGWMGNWEYQAATPTTPWRGAMTVPRELSLVDVDGDVRLVQWPPRELAAAEGEVRAVAPFDLAGSWEFEAGACCRVDVEFEPGDADAVGLDLAVGGGAATRLRWDTRTGRLAL
ncbi:hypothetical protein GCM10023148_05710 [Actinokineospora soli]